jgi:hypothetical protein
MSRITSRSGWQAFETIALLRYPEYSARDAENTLA